MALTIPDDIRIVANLETFCIRWKEGIRTVCESLGSLVRKAREDKGIGLNEAVRLFNREFPSQKLSGKKLSFMERGKSPFPVMTFHRLLDVLRIPFTCRMHATMLAGPSCPTADDPSCPQKGCA